MKTKAKKGMVKRAVLFAFLGCLLMVGSMRCAQEDVYADEDLFPALPPAMRLYFVTQDSTGWVMLFPGPLKDGLVPGTHVDSVAVYDENMQQKIGYREHGSEGWYFPSIRYLWNRGLSYQDTLEQSRRFMVQLNATHTDTLDIRYRYLHTPMTRPVIRFEYARFYLNSQLIETALDNHTRLYIPI